MGRGGWSDLLHAAAVAQTAVPSGTESSKALAADECAEVEELDARGITQVAGVVAKLLQDFVQSNACCVLVDASLQRQPSVAHVCNRHLGTAPYVVSYARSQLQARAHMFTRNAPPTPHRNVTLTSIATGFVHDRPCKRVYASTSWKVGCPCGDLENLAKPGIMAP